MKKVRPRAIFNQHPEVKRSALVGIGARNKQEPVIVIEPKNPKRLKSSVVLNKFKEELLELGTRTTLTQPIKKILFYPKFPVDVRHNAKIYREKLSLWAEKQQSNFRIF